MNDKVNVTLFKDGKEYSAPVYVKVNGRALLIPRGVPVDIPREYYEALRYSMKQSMVVNRFENALTASTDSKMAGDGQTLLGVKPPRSVGKVRL